MVCKSLVKTGENDGIIMGAGKNGDLCYTAASVKLLLTANLKQDNIPNEFIDLGKMIFQVMYSECQLVLLQMIYE